MSNEHSSSVGTGAGEAEIRIDGTAKLRLLAYHNGVGWIQSGTDWEKGSTAPLIFSGIYGSPIHMTVGSDGALYMASGAQVTPGGVWTNASSRAVKDNIRELSAEDAAAVLGQLEPVHFNYKVNPEEKHLGFIAEDVPEMVANQDRSGLSPMDIVAILAKVVQEQQHKIAELEKRLPDTRTT